MIFKVMIDAWLMKRAKQIKAHLQEVAELNKYATILANCWRNKQNRCAARIVLDNLRDAKDKQRERQFRRQRKDGALKVQARIRGLLTRKHAREQAEAKRKGVDQVKAAQERLQKLKGHASAEAKVCSSSIAKNAFIERLKVSVCACVCEGEGERERNELPPILHVAHSAYRNLGLTPPDPPARAPLPHRGSPPPDSFPTHSRLTCLRRAKRRRNSEGAPVSRCASL